MTPHRTGSFGGWIRGWLPKEPVMASRDKRRAHSRLGTSALTVAVIVFVAIGIGVELAFLPKTSSSAPTVTMTSTANSTMVYSCTGCSPSPLKNAVDQWVSNFNSRDVTGLGNFYATDAVVDWTGQASGLTGVYNGQGNIRILYGSSIGKTTTLIANISNYNEKDINPSNANVSLTLTMNGVSTVVGNLSISIDANQQWNYVGGQWQIVKETWNYVKFYESTPVSSTTFPQWTAMKLGQNPDLVSEKSFEWHAGPYVAGSVYAFIAGILVLGALKFRNRPRRV
jgi:hypothetical protein